jgi:hypothetical protein
MNKITFDNLTNLRSLLTNKTSRGLSAEVLDLVSIAPQQAEILAAIGGSLTTMYVPQAWINYYPAGMANELHDHAGFADTADHLAIFILESGTVPEKFLYKDNTGTTQEYDAIAGDCFILTNSEIHGLKECAAPFTAAVFLLKTS